MRSAWLVAVQGCTCTLGLMARDARSGAKKMGGKLGMHSALQALPASGSAASCSAKPRRSGVDLRSAQYTCRA